MIGGRWYSWAVYAVAFPLTLAIYLFPSFFILAFEKSDHYVEAAAVTVVAVSGMVYLFVLPSLGAIRLAERWAAGEEVDRATALEATYTWARRAVSRWVAAGAVWAALLLVTVGAIAGASGWRLVQYGIMGAVGGAVVELTAAHILVEPALRPARVALAGDTGIGDSMPRSRPTFAAWANISVLAVAFLFAVSGEAVAAVFDRVRDVPVLWVVIAFALTVGLAVPLTIGAGTGLRPRATDRPDLDLIYRAASCYPCAIVSLPQRRRRKAIFGSSDNAFGTPGAGGSFGFADPDTGIGFAYVMNRMGFAPWSDPTRTRASRSTVSRHCGCEAADIAAALRSLNMLACCCFGDEYSRLPYVVFIETRSRFPTSGSTTSSRDRPWAMSLSCGLIISALRSSMPHMAYSPQGNFPHRDSRIDVHGGRVNRKRM